MTTEVKSQDVKAAPSSREPVTILEGCAYSVLQTLPANSVDCIITSPPYWGLRDYGIEPTDWPACSYAPMPGLPKIKVKAETSCLGLEKTLHAFLAHLGPPRHPHRARSAQHRPHPQAPGPLPGRPGAEPALIP